MMIPLEAKLRSSSYTPHRCPSRWRPRVGSRQSRQPLIAVCRSTVVYRRTRGNRARQRRVMRADVATPGILLPAKNGPRPGFGRKRGPTCLPAGFSGCYPAGFRRSCSQPKTTGISSGLTWAASVTYRHSTRGAASVWLTACLGTQGATWPAPAGSRPGGDRTECWTGADSMG